CITGLHCRVLGVLVLFFSFSLSDELRLVAGRSRCGGRLEKKNRGDWRPVIDWNWDFTSDAEVVCREISCGPHSVHQGALYGEAEAPVGSREFLCEGSESALLNCSSRKSSGRNSCSPGQAVGLTCSDSVRLVQGTNRCSGRLEVKTNQSWSSVCEKDFDLQDAEVVCREIGCGPPSVHQGALYGEAEAPVGSREFLCEGSESALLNCSSRKSSGRNSCSPGQAVGLTCSDQDNFRLVGEASRCAGRLEMLQQEEWRPVDVWEGYWDMNSAAPVCIRSSCLCVSSAFPGLLVEPLIFLSSSTDGVSTGRKQGSELLIGSHFSIICSIRPQYEGGSFQLIFSTSNYTQNQTLPAVNHSALFLFSAAALSDEFRLVAGRSRCVGRLEVKTDQSWSSVCEKDFDLQDAEVVCREIGCGPPSVHQGALYGEAEAPVGSREFLCEGSESALLNCSSRKSSGRNSCSPGQAVGLTCSDQDNIRLVGEASRCAGRLEMLHQEEWRPVIAWYRNWNMNSVAAVCAGLDCGSAVSVRKSKGDSYRPVWMIYSGCSESALLNCSSRKSSGRNNCSPGQAVGLTCSDQDDIRLVGEASRCAGRLEMLHQEEWRPVAVWLRYWTMNSVAVVCAELDCGSAVSARNSMEASYRPVWWISSDCFQSGSALKNCLPSDEIFDHSSEIICSDSVRLVQGTNRCSGRLEVKTNQSWSSVCEKDFDLQDAEVVCREISCGPPSVHQGALYGEAEAPVGSREFLCEGSESALLNCSSRKSSGRNSCSPGQAVGLTCSDQDDIRLVGEASRCAGRLEMLHQEEWRPVAVWLHYWTMNSVAAVCAELDCGSVVSARKSKEASERPVWGIYSDCFQSGSALKNCLPHDEITDPESVSFSFSLSHCFDHQTGCRPAGFAGISPGNFFLSASTDSVRLVQGTNRCSGRLEVKTNQSWSSVCEKDFDLQDAEVVCREIGCGPPSVHQGALYGEAEAPVGSREFLCEGSESALLNCSSRKSSGRNSCSPGQAVGLTCSDNFRLVGEASRCAGRLEMIHQEEWRPVDAEVVCREIGCGPPSVHQGALYGEAEAPVGSREFLCEGSESALLKCSSRKSSGRNSCSPGQAVGLTCSGRGGSADLLLVGEASRCAGRLEMLHQEEWRPVDVWGSYWDMNSVAAVCAELDCGSAVSVRNSEEAPVGSREFLCEGSESALLNCSSRKSSGRNSCSPGQAVGLTCSGRGGSADLLLFTASLPSLMNSLSLLTSRQHQVGGRGQPMCRETGDDTSRRVETSGCYGSLLEHELSCCSLCWTGLWFCCFSKRFRGSFKETSFLDLVWLFPVRICIKELFTF
uniref:SRCR domain-containing protein n=1 Tax=Xiphophorus maculatus TaxID=8083 RepID=A0A3B5QGI6_XIPMA